jgi:signal transduction histidine kinase/CheY-like chemotaxis protein
MAGDLTFGPEPAPGWGRGALAGAGAIVATLLLALLMIMVSGSNQAREEALASERYSYDVMLLTRTVDASLARAEAALGRYVLDEEQTTGSLYYNEWRLADRQIGELQRLVRAKPEQRTRVEELKRLYARRGAELVSAAAAARAKRGSDGISLFYQAGRSPVGQDLRNKLSEIAAVERQDLRNRMDESRASSSRADDLTRLLGWIAVLIGVAAAVAGLLAFRAMNERIELLRAADDEATRAQALEEAVRSRTQELTEANARLQAEAAERAIAEAQLRQVQKMEAVGQLTGGIAHDFNNMLAVIVGGLDLAKRKLRSSRREVEFHLDNAMEGATRAAALTRRLLAFARAEPLVPISTAPASLVQGMLDLVDRSIGERISVSTRFPAEPWHIRADTNQLENAILNMAVNARDAMDGEGRIAISIDNLRIGDGEVGELASGEYVRISVSDTGAGIPPEIMERVFDPFFTTKPVGKGTGLGLSQIFGFARQSGGDVTLQSAVGEGTTVSIYLPRSAELVVEAAAYARPEDEDTARDAMAGAASTFILVVEDDPRVSRATVGALEELGYHPIACGSGREAVTILEREDAIDLVITDIMMPEMTGPELCRVIGLRWPWIPVLFVTGYAGDSGDGEELSGHEILRKPFTVSGLAGAVAAALARHSSEWRPAEAASAAE